MSLVAFDTNILLYSVDHAGDAQKHELAVDLLDRAAAGGIAVLPLQALAEFYAVAVRKLKAPPDDAAAFVDLWGRVFPVVPAGLADVADSMRVQRDHGLAFWDAMMWSVARRAGVRALLSEDLQDGRSLEGVVFLNPFAPQNAGRIDALLAMPPTPSR